MSIKALQDYTFVSRYARYDTAKKRRETWEEAVTRVKNMHLRRYPQVATDIEWAFERVEEKRALGSQRALQFGGQPIEKHNSRIYNCTVSFCDRLRFFQEAFWLLLCGCGVGFSVQKHHVAKLPGLTVRHPHEKLPVKKFVIPDSIEGWADALGVLLSSYFGQNELSEHIFPGYADCVVRFDYSEVRPAGSSLNSCSGKAPGPEPLRRALEKIRALLDRCLAAGQNRLRPIDAYDVVMHASDAVLSGGVRRSATICIFSPDDDEMMQAKVNNWFYENPQRARSNNSVMLLRGETTKAQFKSIMETVRGFGEPGFLWSDSTEYLVNPSLRGDTKVLTGQGIKEIKDLENKTFKVKNLHGKWSDAKCRLSGKNKELWKVTLSDGQEIFATEGHKWPVFDKRNGIYSKTKTAEMRTGDLLPLLRNTALFNSSLGEYDDGFLCGWLLSDGWITNRKDNGKRQYGFIVSESDEVKDKLNDVISIKTGSSVTWTKRERGKVPVFELNIQRKSAREYFDFFGVEDKKALPSVVWAASDHFRAGLIDALFSADGYVSETKQGIRVGFTTKHEDVATQLRELLSFYGIRSKIYHRTIDGSKSSFPEGKTYDKIYHSYSVVITCFASVIHFARTFVLSVPRKNKLLDRFRKDDFYCPEVVHVKVKKVEKTDSREDVWDISVYDDTHCFQLGGCVTGNCVEIGFWPVDPQTGRSGWAFCNLSETNGGKVKTVEDFAAAVRAATIIGTLQAGYDKFPYLGETTERIVRNEALLGVSITGIMENPSLILSPSVQRQMSQLVLDVNAELAPKIGVNLCARGTCVKPAGTSSCILGTSSGIHPHHWSRYLRRIQNNKMEAPFQHFASVNPHAVEDSVWSANKTDAVITFCIDVPESAVTKRDLSAVGLLSEVKKTQKNWVIPGTRPERCVKPWLTHNVSNTINVKESEWDQVADYIYDNRKYFAGISLLPETGDLDYQQAPMVAILTPGELVAKYGPGAIMASGLIVDALAAFQNNLWLACDAALGLGEHDAVMAWDFDNPQPHLEAFQAWSLAKLANERKKDWVRRARQFASRYFNDDARSMCYCLKQVSLYKTYVDLKREYKDVDYTLCVEEEDNTKLIGEVACAGGACEI